MGVYYVTVLPAWLLLEVAFSDTLFATSSKGKTTYVLEGTQRLVQSNRLRGIADYINREDAAFPNTIILAANFRRADGLIEGDQSEDGETRSDSLASTSEIRRWAIEEGQNGNCWLLIPTEEKLAAIIDGQHRLFAFSEANAARLSMNLICSVFLDLPKPYQAQLFPTINSTQKPVNKSLTYELFGYNVEEEKEVYWSPDKLAVFLTRRLAMDDKSPLFGRIIIAPQRDQILESLNRKAEWKISTAVVVEGIMRLYSTNPKKDTAYLLAGQRKERKALGDLRADRSPLRDVYLSNQDAVLYTIVVNFLIACNESFWNTAKDGSFILKTVGIQALFEI